MGSVHSVLEDIAKSASGDLDAAGVCRCLEIAAALAGGGVEAAVGQVDGEWGWVDWREWQQACVSAGIRGNDSVFESVLESLIAHQIGVRSENAQKSGSPAGRWRFRSAEDLAMLSELSIQEKRWVGIQAACSRALSKYYGDESHDPYGRIVAGRCAQHWARARRVDDALELLLKAQKIAMDSDDHDGCLAFLDQREALLDQMQVGPMNPLRAQNDTRRARSYFLRGDIPRAEALVERALKAFRSSDWASETGYALLLYGRIRTGQSRYGDALRLNDDASGYLAVAGDEHGLTRARANKAYVLMLQGHYKAGRRGMLKAIETFKSLDDRFMVAVLHNFIAQTWLGDGDQAEATQAAEIARATAVENGYRMVEATAWMVLGEIARRAEDWDLARHQYAEALELYLFEQNRAAHVAHYNIALAEIGAGEFGAARRILLKLVLSYVNNGYQSKLPLIYVALMVCAVERADWEAWEESYAQFERSLPSIGGAHEDIAWLAERGFRSLDAALATAADAQTDLERLARIREQFYSVACQQNDLLGNDEKLDALRTDFAASPMAGVAQPS